MESSKETFVSYFKDAEERKKKWNRVNANYSTIMAEYEDALSCFAQELAHVQSALNRIGTTETIRRGAPPPMDSSQAKPYTTPPPDWSTVNTEPPKLK